MKSNNKSWNPKSHKIIITLEWFQTDKFPTIVEWDNLHEIMANANLMIQFKEDFEAPQSKPTLSLEPKRRMLGGRTGVGHRLGMWRFGTWMSQRQWPKATKATTTRRHSQIAHLHEEADGQGEGGRGRESAMAAKQALQKALDPIWNWASRRYQAAVAKELKKYGEWNPNWSLCPGFYVTKLGQCIAPVWCCLMAVLYSVCGFGGQVCVTMTCMMIWTTWTSKRHWTGFLSMRWIPVTRGWSAPWTAPWSTCTCPRICRSVFIFISHLLNSSRFLSPRANQLDSRVVTEVRRWMIEKNSRRKGFSCVHLKALNLRWLWKIALFTL